MFAYSAGGWKMNQETQPVSYDQVYLKPVKARIDIFNSITAENRAFLVKTHAERWLRVNRPRLTPQQLAAVEELIHAISPEWYRADRNWENIEPEIEVLVSNVEAVLSREDVRQLATNRAEYIPEMQAGID
jgi:hypothetical protein